MVLLVITYKGILYVPFPAVRQRYKLVPILDSCFRIYREMSNILPERRFTHRLETSGKT
jgi:hypothetical protein